MATHTMAMLIRSTHPPVQRTNIAQHLVVKNNTHGYMNRSSIMYHDVLRNNLCPAQASADLANVLCTETEPCEPGGAQDVLCIFAGSSPDFRWIDNVCFLNFPEMFHAIPAISPDFHWDVLGYPLDFLGCSPYLLWIAVPVHDTGAWHQRPQVNLRSELTISEQCSENISHKHALTYKKQRPALR